MPKVRNLCRLGRSVLPLLRNQAEDKAEKHTGQAKTVDQTGTAMTKQQESSKPFDSNFLDQCKSITKDYEKLKGRWSPEAQILHIHSEVEEFNEALRKKTKYDVMEEWADIILTTIATANYFGITNGEINDILKLKLKKVKQRVKDSMQEK